MSQQQGQSGKRGILSSSGESLDTAVDAGDARGPFVGRGPEITALRDAATLAIDGRGGLVLLVGEPGIGKTRLAEELAVDASARGLCVLWGRCWEGAGTQAFWPWIQVLRGSVWRGRRCAFPGLGPYWTSACAYTLEPAATGLLGIRIPRAAVLESEQLRFKRPQRVRAIT